MPPPQSTTKFQVASENLIPLLSKICNEKEIKERNARSVSGDSEHKVQSNLKSIFIAKEN